MQDVYSSLRVICCDRHEVEELFRVRVCDDDDGKSGAAYIQQALAKLLLENMPIVEIILLF